jgi:hypothetical protein
MKLKKPLLLVVLTLVLLAVALILPATGYGKAAPDNSWASININSNHLLLPTHTGMTGKVQLSAGGTLTGQVILKDLRWYENGAWVHFKTTLDTFADVYGIYFFAPPIICHGEDYPGVLLGDYDYTKADIAEFVAYVPNPAFDPNDPTLAPPSIALKFLWIDFGQPGKITNLEQWYVFMPPPGSPTPEWVPQDIVPGYLPYGVPVPIPNGHVLVHVGG